MSLENQCQN